MNLSQLAIASGISRDRLRSLLEGRTAQADEMARLERALDIPLDAWTSEVDS